MSNWEAFVTGLFVGTLLATGIRPLVGWIYDRTHPRDRK